MKKPIGKNKTSTQIKQDIMKPIYTPYVDKTKMAISLNTKPVMRAWNSAQCAQYRAWVIQTLHHSIWENIGPLIDTMISSAKQGEPKGVFAVAKVLDYMVPRFKEIELKEDEITDNMSSQQITEASHKIMARMDELIKERKGQKDDTSDI